MEGLSQLELDHDSLIMPPPPSKRIKIVENKTETDDDCTSSFHLDDYDNTENNLDSQSMEHDQNQNVPLDTYGAIHGRGFVQLHDTNTPVAMPTLEDLDTSIQNPKPCILKNSLDNHPTPQDGRNHDISDAQSQLHPHSRSHPQSVEEQLSESQSNFSGDQDFPSKNSECSALYPQHLQHMKDRSNTNRQPLDQRAYDKPLVQTRFSDIIGHGSAKLRLDEMLLPLALPPSLAKSVLTGVRAAPASILLYGPPGCGKTKLARAVAGEAQAAFLSVGPSDVLSKFVGESEASIKDLFKEARDKAMSMESSCTVLFFDEIDALGMSRGGSQENGGSSGGNNGSGGGGGENGSRRVLAELLIQLTKLANGDSNQATSFPGSSNEDEDEYQRKSKHEEHNSFELRRRQYSNTGPQPSSSLLLDGDGDGDQERDQERESFMEPSEENENENDGEEPQRDVQGSLATNSSDLHIISPTTTSTLSQNESTDHDLWNHRNGDDHEPFPSHTTQTKSPPPSPSPPQPRIIVIAATNRPEDCDPALLRRFAIRVLVGVPSRRDRRRIIIRLLSDIDHSLTPHQLEDVSVATEGWSGSDLESLTREAAMAPVRECLRVAACMKVRARRKRVTRGSIGAGESDGDGTELARNTLLNGFRNLRPVTVNDFEQAVSFCIGDVQQSLPGRLMNKSSICHYDSSDSESNGDTGL